MCARWCAQHRSIKTPLVTHMSFIAWTRAGSIASRLSISFDPVLGSSVRCWRRELEHPMTRWGPNTSNETDAASVTAHNAIKLHKLSHTRSILAPGTLPAPRLQLQIRSCPTSSRAHDYLSNQQSQRSTHAVRSQRASIISLQSRRAPTAPRRKSTRALSHVPPRSSSSSGNTIRASLERHEAEVARLVLERVLHVLEEGLGAL